MSKKKAASKKAEPNHKEENAVIDVQAATLVGGIRDQILTIFKNHADWKKIPEAKQRDIAEAAEYTAKDVVRRSAKIIAGRGFKSVNGTVKQVAVKDGLKIVIEASGQSPHRHDLMDSQGGGVTIVLSDIAPFMSQRSEPEIDVDEPTLPIDKK
jgi:hypothetical protein